MTQYVPIKTLCQQTGLCEKTIRRLIRKHGLSFHRTSARGKILVSIEDFESICGRPSAKSRKMPSWPTSCGNLPRPCDERNLGVRIGQGFQRLRFFVAVWSETVYNSRKPIVAYPRS